MFRKRIARGVIIICNHCGALMKLDTTLDVQQRFFPPEKGFTPGDVEFGFVCPSCKTFYKTHYDSALLAEELDKLYQGSLEDFHERKVVFGELYEREKERIEKLRKETGT